MSQRTTASGRINMKINTRAATNAVRSKSSKMKPIVLDVATIILVLFLMTTISCWYMVLDMIHSSTQSEAVTTPYPIADTSPTFTPVMSQTDCDKLKVIYDKAYVKALHPMIDYVDWDSLDKIFYDNNKDCS